MSAFQQNCFFKIFGLWVLTFIMFLPHTASAQAPVDFSDLAERLLPTVVNVSTTQAMPEGMPGMSPEVMPQLPPGSPFEDFFNEFFERHQNNPQMTPNHPSSLGSGFVIDAERGYIVTNAHVIRDAEEIKIILNDDSTLNAEVIGTDDKTDIAVLKVNTDKEMIAAQWGDSDQARVGSWVIAIGNPFGLGGTVTSGIVSARQRDINAGPYDDFIQTDASINRGNSGGPMFNMNGEVIGVNTAIFSPSGGSVGIGFAVPSSMARIVVEQLIEYGQTRRGWLGVRIQNVTDEIAESLGLDRPRGALIASLTEDGPAKQAGIEPGDIILSFKNQPITSMRLLPRIVAETEVNSTVDVVLWRNKREQTVRVTLGELETAEENGFMQPVRPETAQESSPEVDDTEISALKLHVAPINNALRQKYRLAEDAQGLVITQIDQTSNAFEKGLREGEIIAEVDQEAVNSVSDIANAIQAAHDESRGSILLLMKSGTDIRFVAVRLTEE